MNNTKSGFPRLSGDYNKGYTKAIFDIMEVFKYVNDDLITHYRSRMNYKWVEKILKCCIENREQLRDDWNGFVRVEKSESGRWDIVKWYSQKDKGGRTK